MIEELKKAKNIGIVVSDYENIEYISSVLVFFLIAKKINKQVYYKINENLSLFPQTKKTSAQILLNVEKEISDVYYEKSGKDVKLYLTPKDKEISISDFSCNLINLNQEMCCDTIIAIGFKNLKDLESTAKIDFKNLESTKIINIDNSHLNKLFGKINLIENGASISKVLFDNLKDDLIDKNLASLLLSGIREGEVGSIEKLIAKGGKLDTSYKIKNLISVLNEIKLEKNIYVAEIENLEQSDIPFILQIIKEYLCVPNFLLIYNKKNCIFYTQNKENLEKIKAHFNAQIKNKGGIFSKENLTKEEILNIL